MDESRRELNLGAISFITKRTSYQQYSQNGKLENKQRGRDHQRTTTRPLTLSGSSDIPNSPTNAMEFLSRSWSPSSSDLLQAFSHSFPQNLLLPLPPCDPDEEQGKESLSVSQVQSEGATKGENIRIDLNHTKGWLRGQPLTGLLRSRRVKREELRFQTAKLHVALSVTRLAAAIASFVSDGGPPASDRHMQTAVASAAALVTTVWAETAETLGAHKAQIASAINAGWAIQSPMDMIALTATAATCLRGAATLELRAIAESNFQMSKKMLRVGAKIFTVLPSGHIACKWVAVDLKHDSIILSLRKKYLGGFLTTSMEYKAISITEETYEAQGYYFMSLKTNKGIIKLLFQDKKQFNIWFSAISDLLKRNNLL